MLVPLALCVRDKDCVDVGETERVSVALALDEDEAVLVPEGDPDREALNVTEAVCVLLGS